MSEEMKGCRAKEGAMFCGGTGEISQSSLDKINAFTEERSNKQPKKETK